ncbi:hypothetical protein NP233_g3811 [Leucocoprinus birnbaumii]|uniref:Nucleolar 27S pre-rRNA processing Urb2/Npa2 C-terminal domain-containing protein n=1 Tax=Leucocoprinus birnbaumii TaxID=56174 RepID=A0AAD5YSG6_9AGAR|nr:hypothetical protein NP233_g3811 [Leucocoprinus birnbaumii]
MTAIQTSQEFIRALKAPSDPPTEGGPTKIEIARQSWDNNAFFLPSKPQVVADWLLSSLLKDKSQPPSTSSIFNLNYWKLLVDVLLDDSAASANRRTWLPSLLHRIPLQPILSTFLSKFGEAKSPEELSAAVAECISLTWRLSSRKMLIESLTDLFNLVLQITDEENLTPGIIRIGIFITSSYRGSLGNVMNKKKFYHLFLQSSLPRWLRVLSKASLPPLNHSSEEKADDVDTETRFYQNIYDSGTDTLFNLELLRQLSENPSTTDHSTILFDNLRKARHSPSESHAVLSVLPRIFLSYVQGIKKHRGAVFSQSSKIGGAALNDEVNAASMRFFANCEAVVVGEGVGDDPSIKGSEVWEARLRLLEGVFEEKLFTIRQDDASMALGAIVEDAIVALGHSWKDEFRDVISPVVKCLTKIGQIDCDLLLPSIPRILPPLLPISTVDPSPSYFLDLILDYHTKTRTLNDHVHNLLSSFLPPSFPSRDTTSIHEVYERCFAGHLLSHRHLGKLGQAIQTFLTPGQTPKCVGSIIDTLKATWQGFYDASEGNGDDAESQDVNALAVSFSSQAYLVLLVLSNLPMKSLTEDSTAVVQNSIIDFRLHVLHHGLKKLLKVKRLVSGKEKKKRRESMIGSDGWSVQIVATALLRVGYAMNIARGLGLQQEDMDKMIEQAKEIVVKEGGNGNLIAELELEIFRALLYHISLEDTREDQAQVIFDTVLSYLKNAFSPSDSTWSGLPCQLRTPETGALAVLHLILERWLPLLDRLASPSQLTAIVQIILGMNLGSIPSAMDGELRPEHLLLRLLHSAEFWEMQNLRSSVLSHLTELTSTSSTETEESELAAYRLLLYVPAEYFTRAARNHFVKRAYELDVQLVQGCKEQKEISKQSPEQQKRTLRDLTTLRVFLWRAIKLVGFERVSDINLGEFIVHLLSFDYEVASAEHDLFLKSTLDLTGICFSELLRNASSHSDSLLRVFSSFGQHPVFRSSNSTGGRTLQSQIIASLVTDVIKLKDTTILSSECVDSLREFHVHLSKAISQQLESLKEPQVVLHLDALVGWCCVLGLRRWLGEEQSQNDARLGKQLVSLAIKLPQKTEVADNCRVSIFAILQAEMILLAEEQKRRKQLECIVAAFTVLYECSGDVARRELDTYVSVTTKGLTPDDYSHILSLVSESLESDSLPVEKLGVVVHLANLLLKSHPQHTLKYMQTFTTRCLNTLSANRVFTRDEGGTELRLLTLDFVVQHCSERPATLRSADMGSIFMIMFSLVRPCEERDEKTTPEVFHKIIASLSALIRLRRDLVVRVLPHLGLVLGKLVLMVFNCRPQLGVVQTHLAMRNFPRWIATKQPLGLEEGRMLSRLLETLNVKTVIRSHTASETQKAESLAKPFSKHAAYVLESYIKWLSEPLCVIGGEMRRELEPGLFTLCEIMGELARDALMVTLDSSGKGALRLIWKEYEKQRGRLLQRPVMLARSSCILLSLRQTATVFTGLARPRGFASVSPGILPTLVPPPPPLGHFSLLDSQLLSRLESSKDHTHLSTIVKQYVTQTGNILGVSLPYESRPRELRRPRFAQAHPGMVLIAHCIRDGIENKIALSSGFALDAPSPSKDETLILTCAHTLEEAKQSPLFLPDSPAYSGLPGTVTGSFCVTFSGERLEDMSVAMHPITGVVSSLPRSDLLLLSCKIDKSKHELQSLPVSPYPAHAGTSVKAHFVAMTKPKTEGWYPWIGGTWGKWVDGKVLGYRDFAGREAEPGTYDSLSHLLFKPHPTPGSSGGPIIEESSGAVVGVMLGSRMDNRIEGLRGWGVPSETIFEVAVDNSEALCLFSLSLLSDTPPPGWLLSVDTPAPYCPVLSRSKEGHSTIVITFVLEKIIFLMPDAHIWTNTNKVSYHENLIS